MSAEFSNLADDIDKLKLGLMSFQQRDDGAYTLEERLKCQAFIVFSHAEIENYFEKVGRRIMAEAKARWEESRVPDRVVATLLAYRRKEITAPPDDPKNPSNKTDLLCIVKDCLKIQEKVISENNGIKRSNVSDILCPLGVFPDDLDEVLLIQLTQTGRRRGDFVHERSTVSLPKIRDPISVELQEVIQLIKELEKFDAQLENLGLLSVKT